MRILLKISWDAFSGDSWFWIDSSSASKLAKKIKKVYDTWVEIIIVLGWWNIYRWKDLILSWVNPADSHNMSMLSTVFNWITLKNFLSEKWLDSIVLDSLWIKFLEKYNKDNAIGYLESKKIVICVWWTWNPYFTTDSGGVLRALETKCDFMIKATKVDWVYDKDPMKYKDAKFIKSISFDEFISKNLKVLDPMSVALAKDNSFHIRVINLSKKDSILNVVEGKKEGTLIYG